MFQTFAATTQPDQGPPRLAALRAGLVAVGLDGFLIPRADAHQGEYVAPSDERLAWLTGFTGSAGFAVALPDRAAIFVDGRYRTQVRDQVDTDAFTPVNWPETRLGRWLAETCETATKIGFDPWLHTWGEIETLRKTLSESQVTLTPCENMVDRIWTERPAPPQGPARAYPTELAGRTHAEKREMLAEQLRREGQSAAVLTLPDSICWFLNIRGSDIVRIPVVHAFAILHADASVDLYAHPAKTADLGAHLGESVRCWPAEDFAPALSALSGKVRVDRNSAPFAVADAVQGGTSDLVHGPDPCLLPKACKTDAEIAGSETAHLRDGVAMAEFLCWLDAEAAMLEADPDHSLNEIDVAKRLEEFRRATNRLLDISFDTISASGPHAALPHYRVTEGSNRALRPGEIFLVDSGGQYLDGTTDITRTVAIGEMDQTIKVCFTRVLKGMIAISRIRWPEGLAGRDLDPLARQALWLAGLDFDHGTGHGVGSYLSVHEGPQRLARTGTEPFRPGMIVSNEPGYYREGAFGIRIENLVLVETAPPLPGGDDRKMLNFRTLSFVPIDRRLIVADMLTGAERDWLNLYHAETRKRLGGLVAPPVRAWLEDVTAPI
ncbi:MAG: aminopeptidase P family protein [Pseudomonadota bacterium]